MNRIHGIHFCVNLFLLFHNKHVRREFHGHPRPAVKFKANRKNYLINSSSILQFSKAASLGNLSARGSATPVSQRHTDARCTPIFCATCSCVHCLRSLNCSILLFLLMLLNPIYSYLKISFYVTHLLYYSAIFRVSSFVPFILQFVIYSSSIAFPSEYFLYPYLFFMQNQCLCVNHRHGRNSSFITELI